ncbi:uncharacterized protein LOC110874211 isoform X1 [Helianthus annuus]|uniref:uncharacterized protein LOC110874211 isoform X1 n=1 Tax=Helianthus annuus TaxID=4232 RepID=UPI000B8F524C|nr:uncharacterized protein LOC110874211 isoform X1 [Helianthus annuus]
MLCSYEKKGVSIFEVYSDEKHKFADGVIFALDRWRIGCGSASKGGDVGTRMRAHTLYDCEMYQGTTSTTQFCEPSILITIVSLSALGCVTDQRFQQLCQFML